LSADAFTIGSGTRTPVAHALPLGDAPSQGGVDFAIARPLPLESLKEAATPSELAEAATEFEAYFLNVLLREMRKTLAGDTLFSGDAGSGSGGYQALLDDALARHAARAGGIGLADQLTRQWEGPR